MTVINPTLRRVFLLAGHADDELLMMGLIAAHHALVGRRLSFILGSPGRTTNAINYLNEKLFSPWWGRMHDMRLEGYDTVTQDDIEISRDKEFTDSCGLLGALPEEIHLNQALRHDNPTIDQAKAVLQWYRELDPAAGFYTHHWRDTDPTHAMYGRAMKELHDESPKAWTDIRWVVREDQALAPVGDADRIASDQYVVPAQYVTEAKTMARQAMRAYSCWAPKDGRYAIGFHSVGLSLFPSVQEGNPNWIVRP